MIAMTSAEALKILGFDKFSQDIEYMCKQTYNFWYDSYYASQLEKYPSWKTLYDIYMKLAQGEETYDYIRGFVAIRDNKIVGYCSMNYNDFITPDSDKLTLWLSDVFVWPEYRSLGIAHCLIDKVKQTARELDSDIYLACEDKLVNFYKKQGWKIYIPNKTNLSEYWNIMTFY